MTSEAGAQVYVSLRELTRHWYKARNFSFF
jgi:hypothetical protein